MYHPSVLRSLALSVCALCLAACDDQPSHSSTPMYQPDHSAAFVKANQISRQWEQQFEAEHTLRLQAEAKLIHQEAARTWWQTTATFLAVVAVVLLGLGATLGSAARHESQKP